MIVKPATQGSSVGMTKVERAEDCPRRTPRPRNTSACVFAEAWITGGEYTVAILQGRALPSIRIETPRTFYDYQAKYFRDDTRYHCPSGLSGAGRAASGESRARGVRCRGRARLGPRGFHDGRRRGRPLLLELNTIPGMTDHSLVPMAARAAGMDFDELVWRVLETSFTREARERPDDRRTAAKNRRKQSEQSAGRACTGAQVDWRRWA